MRKVILILLPLTAFLAGAVGGETLRGAPPPQPVAVDAAGGGVEEHGGGPVVQDGEADAGQDAGAEGAHAAPAPAESDEGENAQGASASFQFPQQFFVPLIRNGRLDSTMVLSLGLTMPETATEAVHAHELKLRDALLRRLLIQANTGGFDGNFTAESRQRAVRDDLTRAAQEVLPGVDSVLIADIARQERS